MSLSRREEIAIALLVSCAESGADRIRTEDAALHANASTVQAAQIVHALMRAGLLATVRGKNGGIRLVRPPEHISVGEVLRLLGRKASPSPHGNDPLSAIAAAAEAQARHAFESFTIADLASGTIDDKLACFQCTIRLGAWRGLPRRPGIGLPPAFSTLSR
jgi:Rrf2 family protein